MSKGGLNPKTVIFIGLMLGMLVAAVSQTIVSPAMPVIVAELGGSTTTVGSPRRRSWSLR